MATTQDKRLMQIFTPLGKDFLLINKLSASEGLSELFSFEVELLHEEAEPGYAPTVVDANSLLGQSVTVALSQRDGTTREFTGMVNQFSQGTRHVRFSFYYMTIVPHVWLLTQNYQSRIFQQKSVPDILKEVFTGFEVSWEIQGNFAQRNYCVQYRESDFAFASRLMEEEGIYYYFEHSGGKHKMVVANTPQSHRDCPGKSSIPFFVDVTRSKEDYVTSIHNWQNDYQLQTGKVTLWDHNFQLPSSNLAADKPSLFTVGDNQKLEFYDFPGGYSRKYDGISKDGGEQSGELQKIFEDNRKTAEIRMQAMDVRQKTASGHSDCSSMIAGYRFSLTQHPNGGVNGKYVITSIIHEAEQNPTYVSDEDADQPYKNTFEAVAHGAGAPPFRPDRKTPKPVIYGTQTAVVVGPSGEEIFTDKYGRVKVQFNWDRQGKVDSNSSCWIRVAQSWASKRWGMMFIPRIGMECVVHFIEGDPDQPIITGCVYNAEMMPPYTLPDEKTKMTIKSNSSKGGAGFNELRFEDKKGEEQIFIHAEKNQDIRVKNDVMETIKHDRHLIVENDQYEKVKKDKHLQVGGDQNEKVDGTVSLKVGSDLQEKVGSNYALDAGTAVHIKAGTSAVIEAGAALTLKVGGNFVNISSAGVTISGSMILINSGGAAGSGAGASPDTPKDPKEADKAEAGAAVGKKTPPPPPNPKNYSPMASALSNAAEKGTPFCAICG
jgi:type VI secretion system secreted protein VgrG